ncbi:hypothetical protein [Frankia sp. AvcI1]|uniref:hypothetical protein n=1 Tax=Frankia sp. AvcI1 TaxID=573496 RepID=UPI000ADCAD37|nr:hypothetical protein [Frankia sp. AvcI1]
MREPRDVVDDLEHRSHVRPARTNGVAQQDRRPPAGEDRFAGYGVMGLPFRSGHVLGLRRFPESSLGPGYRSVWHRDPAGRWTFYQDQPAELACTRYFGSAVDEVRQGPIHLDWTGPRTFRVTAADGDLDWTVTVGATPVTRLFSTLGSALPDRAWRSRPLLGAMSRLAGAALGAGRVRLTGLAPDGQQFAAHPLRLWVVTDSAATVRGVRLGEPGPIPAQAFLRDFAIPQRGVLVVGRAVFSDPGATVASR